MGVPAPRRAPASGETGNIIAYGVLVPDKSHLSLTGECCCTEAIQSRQLALLSDKWYKNVSNQGSGESFAPLPF